jgi:hypothetical protein
MTRGDPVTRRCIHLPIPPRRRLAGLLLASLLAGTGCNSTMPIESITAVLDAAPRPPSATLVEEHVTPAKGDSSAVVTRTYRTSGEQPACQQLLTATRGTGWSLYDRLGGPLRADTCDPAVTNPTYADPGNDRQRRGRLNHTSASSGGIDIEWRHDELSYILDEGSLPD